MLLSDAEIEALPLKHRMYKHSLGNGLYIQVWPNGSKYWRVRYRFAGLPKTYSIGVFPHIPVTEAIQTTNHIRKLLLDGKDPMEVMRQALREDRERLPQSLFRLSISPKGELTIESNTKLMILSPSQTNALKSFLAIGADEES